MSRIIRYLFVTNRGPVQLGEDGQTLVRSGGGLASGLLGLMEHQGDAEIRWLFPISTQAELEAARMGQYQAIHLGLTPTSVDADDHRIAYEIVANQYFWYLFHGLFDLSFEPIFNHQFFDAYEHYRRFNAQLAQAAWRLDLTDTMVIINDYHLMLVPHMLRSLGFDGPIALFFHTPICTAAESKLMPATVRDELATSFSAANVIGLHAHQWEQNLVDSFGEVGPALPPTIVAPIPADTQSIVNSLDDVDVAREKEQMAGLTMGLPTLLRVDRIEPSKNLVRGVWAIDEFLRRNPKAVGEFRALLFAYPSRSMIPKYRRLVEELTTLVGEVNDHWSRSGWQPIHLDLSDRPKRSLASYQLFDTLLVNPLRDGLNLVVFEAALAAKPNAQIVLSTGTGAAEHIGQWVELIDPLDIVATAQALEKARLGGDLAPLRAWTKANTWTNWLETISAAIR